MPTAGAHCGPGHRATFLSGSIDMSLGRFARTRRRSPHFSPRGDGGEALQPDREGEPVRLPNLSNKAKLAAVAAIVAVPAVALPIAFATRDGGLPGVGSGGDGAAYAFPATPDHIPDTPVRVNQVGYLPDGPKDATVVTDATDALPWQLKNAAGTVVASGTTTPARRGRQLRPERADDRLQRVHRQRAPATRSSPTARPACPFDIGADAAYEQAAGRRAERSTTPQRSGIEILDSAAPRLRPRRPATSASRPTRATPSVPCQPGVVRLLARRHAAAGTTPATTASTSSTAASPSHQLMSSYERTKVAAGGRADALGDGTLRHPGAAATACPTCSTRPAGSSSSC